MPWSSADLPVLEPSPSLWPLRIAAETLGPPELSERQLRDKLRAAGIKPVGKMRSGVPGHSRHIPLYSAVQLIELYESLPPG